MLLTTYYTQACDHSSHLDLDPACLVAPTSTQDTAITNFGNIMIKDALKISYLDIFQASTAIRPAAFQPVLTFSVKYVGS